MTRQQILAELDRLVDAAEAAGELSLAQNLLYVIGATMEGTDRDVSRILTEWAQSRVRVN